MIFGAHVTISQGLIKALDWAEDIKAQSIQFFSGNPRGWQIRPYPDREVEEYKRQLKERDLGPVFLHSVYLINLGSKDKDIYDQSISSLKVSLEKAEQIKAEGVVTHIGSAQGSPKTRAMERVVRAIKKIFKTTSSNLILENSAGAGEKIGDQIEELAEIIGSVKSNRLKVCLDTCHLFASGYNIKKKRELDRLIKQFDQQIGLDHLVLIHLNDSKGGLGSHLDRHLNIGQGQIGIDGFRAIVNQPALKDLPGIIETPSIDQDDQNLKILRELSNED